MQETHRNLQKSRATSGKNFKYVSENASFLKKYAKTYCNFERNMIYC